MPCDLLSLLPLGACFVAPQMDDMTGAHPLPAVDQMTFPVAEEHAMETVDLRPFLAQFDVALNGEVIGFANMEVRPVVDSEFDVEFKTKITRGVGGFARARINETAHLMVHEGNPRSIHYRKEKKHIFDKEIWSADFDWATNHIVVEADDKGWDDMLTGIETDQLTLFLYLAQAAKTQVPQFEYTVIDDDGPQEFDFDLRQGEVLETPCGNYETVVYQGVYPGSYKKIWTWHVAELDWLPVRVRKTRKDGDWAQLDMRAIESQVAAELNCGDFDE